MVDQSFRPQSHDHRSATLFVVVAIIGMHGGQLMHFWGSLLLPGVGWNLLFVGGTALLLASYTPAEKFKAKAANDFVVFGSQDVSSLGGLVSLQFRVERDDVLMCAFPPRRVRIGFVEKLAGSGNGRDAE